MGGARGDVSFAIATKFYKLKLINQDLPSMVTPETIAAIPAELKSRVSFQVHDFFTSKMLLEQRSISSVWSCITGLINMPSRF